MTNRETTRGRHRRPRARRVFVAVGGLALAAGALSVVRLAPESVIWGMGTPDGEPTTGTVTDTAGNAAATVGAVSSALPVAATTPAVMGGENMLPTPGVSLAPTPASTPTRLVAGPSAPVGVTVSGTPDTTGIPTGQAPAPAASQPPAAATAAPAPSATTPAPTPTPTASAKPKPPGLCVPIIGLCVNGLNQPLGGR
ncbi:hypothetical protein ACFYPC_22015 [Streptomyces sp. NPDC005808]|uniref:hypothetical protein n=1 Tax=Streptomyces sp. NPDC005808 TaxID=3364734 RepID=UPI003694721F